MEYRILKIQFGEGLVSANGASLRFRLLEPLSPVFDLASDVLSKASLRPFWGRMVGPREVSNAFRVSEPKLVIWLLVRGPNGGYGIPYTRCWIMLPDGQEFWTGCNSGDGNGRESLYWIDLYEVPRTLKRLKLRLEPWEGGVSVPLEIDNPAYLADRPNWQPEALPQAKRVGNFEVTLNAITSRNVPMPAPNSTTWIADPQIQVRPLNGERNEWYDFWTWIAGVECGEGPAMFYQPCWKVKFSITPREDHPQFGTAKKLVVEFFVKPPAPPVIK